jgi:hypothetical protein
MLRPLRAAGYKVLRIHLNPGMEDWREPTREKVAEYKADGWLVHGACYLWPAERSALGWAQWAGELVPSLGLQGFAFNGEKEVETVDFATDGLWSREFCTEWRRLRPTLPSCLNTYPGLAIFPSWEQAKFRLYLQAHKDPNAIEPGWQNVIEWAKLRGWKNAATVKAQVGCFVNDEGERPTTKEVIDALTLYYPYPVGIDVYPGDSCMDDVGWLVDLAVRAKAAGVAR